MKVSSQLKGGMHEYEEVSGIIPIWMDVRR